MYKASVSVIKERCIGNSVLKCSSFPRKNYCFCTRNKDIFISVVVEVSCCDAAGVHAVIISHAGRPCFSHRTNIEFIIGVAVHKRGASAGRTTAGFSVFIFYLRAICILIRMAAPSSVYKEIGQHGDVIDSVAVKIAHHHVYAQLIKAVRKCRGSASAHAVIRCSGRGIYSSGIRVVI